MSIEVKQMVIKSNVVKNNKSENSDNVPNQENIKAAILEECKRLIVETLQEMKER